MNPRLESLLDRVASLPRTGRNTWSAMMAVVGLGAVAAAIVFEPHEDGWTYVFDHRFGGPCGFRDATGLPCPSCGMTRSWVWLVRGHVIEAFMYNPAGALLLMGLAVMGVIGAIRLVTRDPERVQIPLKYVSTAVMVWMIVPYLGGWFLRMAGFNPLPLLSP
jgi:hypothetical protein